MTSSRFLRSEGCTERLKAYMTIDAAGGAMIDNEQLLTDLVSVAKAVGLTKEQFLKELSSFWDGVELIH